MEGFERRVVQQIIRLEIQLLEIGKILELRGNKDLNLARIDEEQIINRGPDYDQNHSQGKYGPPICLFLFFFD